jgi:phospholipase C
MPTNVYVANALTDGLTATTQIAPALSSEYWSAPQGSADVPDGGGNTELYWIDRDEGITDGATWVVTSIVTLGGTPVELQVQLTGTFASSDIAIQIAAAGDNTGWQIGNTRLTFTAADGNDYVVVGTYVSDDVYNDVVFAVSEQQQGLILPQIEHVVVLMMENRSLDNLLGWIYPTGTAPGQVLPAGSCPDYDGLQLSFSNSDPGVNGGQPVHVTNGTTDWDEGDRTITQWFVPSPDPGEEFDHVTTQISNNMGGFLTDYVTQQADTPAEQIMQCYSVAQLPILSTLATSFAVSDAWFCSVPSQTWPNRGFVQTGSSDGFVNNDPYLPWDITTIFDVFGQNGLSWMVYNDGVLPSLTKVMFLDKYISTTRPISAGSRSFRSPVRSRIARLPARSFPRSASSSRTSAPMASTRAIIRRTTCGPASSFSQRSTRRSSRAPIATRSCSSCCSTNMAEPMIMSNRPAAPSRPRPGRCRAPRISISIGSASAFPR